jgi:hypothetical protein
MDASLIADVEVDTIDYIVLLECFRINFIYTLHGGCQSLAVSLGA